MITVEKGSSATFRLWPSLQQTRHLSTKCAIGQCHDLVSWWRYDYKILSDHSPGIYWAHPHHHGSTVPGRSQMSGFEVGKPMVWGYLFFYDGISGHSCFCLIRGSAYIYYFSIYTWIFATFCLYSSISVSMSEYFNFLAREPSHWVTTYIWQMMRVVRLVLSSNHLLFEHLKWPHQLRSWHPDNYGRRIGWMKTIQEQFDCCNTHNMASLIIQTQP